MRTFLILLLLVLCCLVAAPLATAQDGGDQAAAQAENTSFGSEFFIVHRTDPSGERSIEVIGSLIIWFLLLLSVVSIGLIGFMALTNQRRAIMPAGVVDEVSTMLKDGRFREAIDLTSTEKSFFSTITFASLSEAGNGYGAMIRALELASDEHTTLRLRRIEYLNVLGQVSPMIGLFGTVYGMILAFQAIVSASGEANPVLLAGGIATALTTTFWGLLVAIPALAGYAIIRNRLDALTTEATHAAEHLINQFRPKAAARTLERAAPEPRPTSA